MKFLLLLSFLPLFVVAQPGPELLFLDPCGMGGYGVPLQDIARNDVQVMTLGVGTDDVPSSSGNCIRRVVNYEHSEFLHEKDRQGYWVIAAPKAGDVLHPDSLKAGLAAGRLRWGPGALHVCYKGYGAQHDGKGWMMMEPRDWERSIVRITTSEAVYLAEMTITLLLPDGTLDVRGRGVLEGTPLNIQ
ncbi:MAG: hypothetical protein IPJ85_13575 [Flavobacteriales bacterium]|nr:hypothetical protein [Flavobacteriales bacterium]